MNFSKYSKNIISAFKKLRKNKRLSLLIVSLLGIAILVFVFFKFLLAATVNGVPITRFEVIRLLERQGGAQALDNLITRKLITQEAERLNINVSQGEIDAELDSLRGALGESGTTLEDALALQGQSLEGLSADIKLQKKVEKILEEDIAVNDEELGAYFEENREFFAENTTLQEQTDNIREQLKEEKLAEVFQAWMEKLRQDSSISRYLNY